MKKRESLLIVVDMQSSFSNSNVPETLYYVSKLVQNAIKKDKYIIFLEYIGHGRTHPSLLYLNRITTSEWTLRWRSKSVRLKKGVQDGSNVISGFLQKEKIENNIKNIIVCGVFTGACVASTVLGLSKKYAVPIRVVKKACGPNEAFAFRDMKRLKNVTLI